MGSFLQTAIKLIAGVEPKAQSSKTRTAFLRHKLTERDLIRLESKIGGELFGSVPAGHRREFFCLDPKTWIWHEEWTDAQTRTRQMLTTRYEIQSHGILKVQDNQPYTMVEGEELKNLRIAMRLYHDQVAKQIYHRDSRTGRPLATATL